MTRVPEYVAVKARRFVRPTYVYDLSLLRERLSLLAALPVRHKRIHFATMANDHPEILAAIAARGHGAFVNSRDHLRLATAAEFPPERIIYATSNMTDDEIGMCLAAGVHLVVDSLGQLAAVDAQARPGTSVGIRVNVGSALDGGELAFDPGYRFGILPEELPDAVRLARRVRLRGVHAYFGTDMRSPLPLIEGLRRLAIVAPALPDLSYVDGGGGFGLPDDQDEPEFDLATYGASASAVMRDLENRVQRPIELVIEPGRWLTGPIAWFFVRVVDIKSRADRIFVGTDASVAQFPRLLLHQDKARHPCTILDDRSGRAVSPRPVWIAGNSTYSRDFLARAARLPEPRIGEVIAFANAGAYCRSMLTRFLGKGAPDELLLDRHAEMRAPRHACLETAE
jgi:diaminopimelate decarboxylase